MRAGHVLRTGCAHDTAQMDDSSPKNDSGAELMGQCKMERYDQKECGDPEASLGKHQDCY